MNLEKEISKEDFINFIEQNNYPQIKRDLFRTQFNVATDRNEFVGACAVGQGLLNAGIFTLEEVTQSPYYAESIGIQYVRDHFGNEFYDVIWGMNDYESLTCEQIAKRLRTLT